MIFMYFLKYIYIYVFRNGNMYIYENKDWELYNLEMF